MLDGVVMTFKHRTTDLKGGWPDGSTGPRSFYETEGYLWRDGTLYEFSVGSSKETLINAMQSLQPRKEEEIPVTEGFCGGRSFFPGKPNPMDYVWFAFRLPIETNTEFRIMVPTGQSPHQDVNALRLDTLKMKKLRDASRAQADFEGKEWIEALWQKKNDDHYATILAASWFGSIKNRPARVGPITGPDDGFPGMEMKLSASTEAKGISPPQVGKMVAQEGKKPITVEEFTALWDGIVASLRPRLSVPAR